MAAQTNDLLERYKASMLLSGVGDALGYKNGGWEFCLDGQQIHKEVAALGGLGKIWVTLPGFRVSDDTVMHLATAEALVNASGQKDNEVLYLEFAARYKECMSDMKARGAGFTCRNAYALQPQEPKGYCIPFDERGGGCGAAMRAMCIGLRYPRPEELDMLIEVSIESGRMTHHHPTGFLGALASALFVSYGVQGKPIREWGAGLMTTLSKAKEYVSSSGRYVEENMESWSYFKSHWQEYLKFRGILNGKSDPVFSKSDDQISGRDKLYTSWSYNGWGGASGHDAPMIAYDALMKSGSSWKELCDRGVFHAGDSDSTGVIAGAAFGVMYGKEGIPECNYKKLEYRERLETLAEKIYLLAYPTSS